MVWLCLTDNGREGAVSVLHSISLKLLPLALDAQECGDSGSRTILTFGMQRSGQHLAIGWICRNLRDCIHFNHCRYIRNGMNLRLTPLTGRRTIYKRGDIQDDSGAQGRDLFKASVQRQKTRNLLYSMEDMLPDPTLLRRMLREKPATIVLILRDPFNWLASSMAHGLSSQIELRRKIDTYKLQLRYALGGTTFDGFPLVPIDYGRFVLDAGYRRELAVSLSMEYSESAEASLRKIPNFGGGSSFSKTEFDDSHQSSVFRRWAKFVDDPFYRSVLKDPELAELADEFFGEFPTRTEVESALALSGN